MLNQVMMPGPMLSGMSGQAAHYIHLVIAGKDHLFLAVGLALLLIGFNIQMLEFANQIKQTVPL